MDQRDRAGRFPVGDEGGRSLDVEFEAVTVFVVAKILGHARSCSVRRVQAEPSFLNRSCKSLASSRSVLPMASAAGTAGGATVTTGSVAAFAGSGSLAAATATAASALRLSAGVSIGACVVAGSTVTGVTATASRETLAALNKSPERLDRGPEVLPRPTPLASGAPTVPSGARFWPAFLRAEATISSTI